MCPHRRARGGLGGERGPGVWTLAHHGSVSVISRAPEHHGTVPQASWDRAPEHHGTVSPEDSQKLGVVSGTRTCSRVRSEGLRVVLNLAVPYRLTSGSWWALQGAWGQGGAPAWPAGPPPVQTPCPQAGAHHHGLRWPQKGCGLWRLHPVTS